MSHENQTREWYAQRVDKQNSEYIELIANGESMSGFFYGVERLPDQTLLFYKSPLDSAVVDGQGIKFTLKRFEFSRQPFHGGVVKDPIKRDDRSIPFFFEHDISYFGNKCPDTLKLKRVLVTYFGRADEAVFVKVAGRG